VTRLLRIVWGAGSPGECHWLRLVELACAVVVTVNLAAAWMRPDPEPAFWVCRPSAVNCREMADEGHVVWGQP
jgi:hypothetical protein